MMSRPANGDVVYLLLLANWAGFFIELNNQVYHQLPEKLFDWSDYMSCVAHTLIRGRVVLNPDLGDSYRSALPAKTST